MIFPSHFATHLPMSCISSLTVAITGLYNHSLPVIILTSRFCHRFTVHREEHAITVIRASSHACLRKGQLVAVHPWPHTGHNHRHELSGRPARSGVRRPPAVLHLLLQRPVVPLLHHPGELQLRTLRRPQAQGQTQPTALLHRGMRKKRRFEKEKEDGKKERDDSHAVKTSRYLLHFASVHFIPQQRRSQDAQATRKPLSSSNENSFSCFGKHCTVQYW